MRTCAKRSVVALLVVAALLVVTTAIAGDTKIPVTSASAEARELFLKGRTLVDNLRLTDANPYFKKAIQLDPKFALAYLFDAQTSASGKEFFASLEKATGLVDNVSEGEGLWIRAVRAGAFADQPTQRKCLTKLAEMYPDDERAQMLLGVFYFGLQAYEDAVNQLKRSTDLAPGFAPAYNQLGYAYRFLGRYDEAEATFKKYTELIPDDPNPYDSYAEFLLKVGRFDEAIVQYKKALAVNQNFANSYAGIAAALAYSGKHDEALKVLDKAAELARTDGEKRAALFSRTVVYVDKGDLGLALKEVDRQYAIAEKGKDAAGMAGDLIIKGNILIEQGDPDAALKSFTKSVECIKSSSLAKEVKENAALGYNYNAARAMLAKKDVAEATKFADRFRTGAEAKKNINQMRLAHELAGSIALAQKKYDVAATELQQANLLNPYNLYRLARSYALGGNGEKAKATMALAAKFNGLPAINYAFIRMKAYEELGKM